MIYRHTLHKRLLLLTMVVFGLAGGAWIVLSHAATTTLAVEPESGTHTTQATNIFDQTASQTSAVKFTKAGASGSYNGVVLADNPVGFWAMTNPSGSEADLTSNAHNGTYQGGTPSTTTMPNGDTAVDFNGTSQYLSIPSATSFSIPTTHKLTWEAWIRPDVLQYPSAIDGYVDWMGKCQDYAPTCEWESRMYSTTNSQNRCNRLSAYVFNSSAGLGSGADWQPDCGLLQAGRWLHVVGEYQTLTTPAACASAYPGSIDIWVNGIKWNQSYHGDTGCFSQYSVAPVANNSPVNIGAMAAEYWFAGAIGKVAIYSGLLTQAQISAHYKAMTGKDPAGSCANTCTTQ